MKLAAPLFLALLSVPASAQLMLGSPKAIDGETIEFGDDMIRLHGIDAPEAPQSCSRDGATWACGEEARDYLATLLKGGRLRCQQVEQDQAGRQVSICSVGGLDLGAEMVKAGMALTLPHAATSYGEYERSAKTQGIGMWSGQFDRPAEYRASNPAYSEPRPKVQPPQRESQSQALPVYYRNCAAAWAAGAAPIWRGQPGYRPELDGDLDGVACEPFRGRRR